MRMSKFLKTSRTRTYENIHGKKKIDILFKCERIIRGLKIKNRLNNPISHNEN